MGSMWGGQGARRDRPGLGRRKPAPNKRHLPDWYQSGRDRMVGCSEGAHGAVAVLVLLVVAGGPMDGVGPRTAVREGELDRGPVFARGQVGHGDLVPRWAVFRVPVTPPAV